jgi:hypothetical protein
LCRYSVGAKEHAWMFGASTVLGMIGTMVFGAKVGLQKLRIQLMTHSLKPLVSQPLSL